MKMRIKAIDEAKLIASSLFLKGDAGILDGRHGYVVTGQTLHGDPVLMYAFSLRELRQQAKRCIDTWVDLEHRYLQGNPIPKSVMYPRWSDWVQARKQIVDNAHGEGTYDWIMERVMK